MCHNYVSLLRVIRIGSKSGAVYYALNDFGFALAEASEILLEKVQQEENTVLEDTKEN